MDEEPYIRLIREIEVEKGKLAAHEGVCAERYKNIEKTLTDFGGKLDRVLAKADANSSQMSSWMMWAIAGVGAVLIGTTGWALGQVYELQTSKPAITQSR